jgi:signal transduction histidine kinase
VDRALALLAAGALLTAALEVAAVVRGPAAAIAACAAFAVLAAAGPAVARRAGRAAPWVYAGAGLVAGDVVFGLAGAGVGVTLLLMVLVSQCVRLLPVPGWLAVVVLVPLVHVGMAVGAGLRNGLGTLAAAAFTAAVTWLLLREQRAREALAAANGELRGFAAQADELATTRERNRLARDIHDGLGHHLTVVAMQVRAARAVLASDPATADSVLAQAQDQAGAALAEVRRSVAALREPRELPPLPVALQTLAAETSATGVPVAVEVCGTPRDVPAETAESVFRTAQEGLTNVCKHAGASTVRLVLDYGDAGHVRLEVRDDGSGAAPAGGGFGLVGLRERAARLGGRLDVESVPGSGTTLTVEVPG